jgi:hypothetical protein
MFCTKEVNTRKSPAALIYIPRNSLTVQSTSFTLKSSTAYAADLFPKIIKTDRNA